MQNLLLDYDKTEWNMFRISDRLARCAQQAVVAKAPPKPILVSLVDIAEDDVKVGLSAAEFITRYQAYKQLPDQMQKSVDGIWTPPSVDGFIIKVSRARGCDASALARSVGEASRNFQVAFGPVLEVWFSIGVDAYDSRSGLEYVSTAESELDSQASCLVSLMKSISDGCADTFKCGVIIQEYADSDWRASVAPAGNQPGCSSAGGSSERMGAATADHLACGERLECPTDQPDCFQPANLSLQLCVYQDVKNALCKLPDYLMCDPYIKVGEGDSTDLPVCAPEELPVDREHNFAWDGLMRAPPYKSSLCSEEAHYTNATLQPRRTFYALMNLWNPPQLANMSTSPVDWTGSRKRLAMHEQRLLRLWSNNGVVTVTMLVWVFITVGLLAGFRMLFSTFKITGRVAVFFTLVVLSILNYFALEHQLSMPFLLGQSVDDILVVLLLLILWCPLNGGGGGHW